MKTNRFSILLMIAAMPLFCHCDDTEQPEIEEQAPAELELSRDEIDFDAIDSGASITLKSNRAWTASCNADWVTISPDSGEASDKIQMVEISVSANMSATSSRQTVVTFSVGDENVDKELAVTQGTGTAVTLTFDPDGGSWSDKTGAEATAVKTLAGIVDAPANYTSVGEPVKAEYSFAGWLDSDDKPVTLPKRYPADNATFKASWTQAEVSVVLSTDDLTFATAGSTEEITITSNYSWTASLSTGADAWLSLDVDEGAPSAQAQTVEITATAYALADEDRTATLTFTAGGQTFNLAITQTKADATVSINPTSLSFTPAGSGETITVTANCAWEIDKNADWVTVSPESGNACTEGTTVTITVGKYTATDADRTATVSFKAGTATPADLGITQTKAEIVDMDVTVTLNPDGGNWNGATANQTFTGKAGTAIDYNSLGNPVKDGYTFDGWLDSESHAATLPENYPADNETYTAKWVKNITITLNPDGGNWSGSTASKTFTGALGSSVDYQSLADPVKTGYIFKGWLDSGNQLVATADLPATYPDADAAYTASWAEFKIWVDFGAEGDAEDSKYNCIKVSDAQAVNGVSLNTEDGTASKVTLQASSNLQNYCQAYANVSTVNPVMVCNCGGIEWSWEWRVWYDGFYIQNNASDKKGIIDLSGLTSDKKYTITLFGIRPFGTHINAEGRGVRETTFTINGESKSIITGLKGSADKPEALISLDGRDDLMTMYTNLQPDSTGKISIEMVGTGATSTCANEVHICALMLQEEPESVD